MRSPHAFHFPHLFNHFALNTLLNVRPLRHSDAWVGGRTVKSQQQPEDEPNDAKYTCTHVESSFKMFILSHHLCCCTRQAMTL